MGSKKFDLELFHGCGFKVGRDALVPGVSVNTMTVPKELRVPELPNQNLEISLTFDLEYWEFNQNFVFMLWILTFG